MKNLFAMKKSKVQVETDLDGKVFLTNKVDNFLKKELQQNYETYDEQVSKGSLPYYLRIIKSIFFLIGIICVSSLLLAIFDKSLNTVYANAPFTFYLGGISLLIVLVLYIIEKNKSNQLINSEDLKNIIDEIGRNVKKYKEILSIPEDARFIDVFGFTYKISKKGKVIINTSSSFKYINTSVWVYVKNDCLCFANVYEEMGIPLTSLIEIRQINKKALVAGWNKEESYRSKHYKKYKIKNNYRIIIIKPYYSVIINDRLGVFEFYVPCYDIDEIVKLTNLKIVK